jgi:hypothetical protein
MATLCKRFLFDALRIRYELTRAPFPTAKCYILGRPIFVLLSFFFRFWESCERFSSGYFLFLPFFLSLGFPVFFSQFLVFEI